MVKNVNYNIVSFKKSKEHEKRNYHMMVNYKYRSVSCDNYFDKKFIKKIKGKKFEDVKGIIKKRIKKRL